MVTHHSEDSYSNKGAKLFTGLYEQLFFIRFHSNFMHLPILPWPGHGGLFGYWFSHINNLIVGL